MKRNLKNFSTPQPKFQCLEISEDSPTSSYNTTDNNINISNI